MRNRHNVLWVIDLPSVSTLSGQSADLSGGLWLPLAFRRPALASEGIPSPLRVPAFVAVGLLRPPQTASGLPCSASARRDGGGCPLYSEGDGVVVFALSAAKTRTDAIGRLSLTLVTGLSRLPVSRFDEASTRIDLRSPDPSSPGLWFPSDWYSPWAFRPCSRPPRCQGRRTGWGLIPTQDQLISECRTSPPFMHLRSHSTEATSRRDDS